MANTKNANTTTNTETTTSKIFSVKACVWNDTTEKYELTVQAEFNYNFDQLVKDEKYFTTGLNWYNCRAIRSDVENTITKYEKKLRKGSFAKGETEESVKEAKERLEALLTADGLVTTYEKKFNFTDKLKDEFKTDPILNACAIACGFRETVGAVSTKKIMDFLKDTLDKPFIDGKKQSELVELLQDVLNNYSILTATDRYSTFKFRANKTLAAEVYRVYYKGRKLDKNGNYAVTGATVEQVFSEIKKAIVARLQRVADNNEDKTTAKKTTPKKEEPTTDTTEKKEEQ